MSHRFGVGTVAIAMGVALAVGVAGQSARPELQPVTRAAEALGGRDRVMALKTLQIVGFGELAYMDGGGNITGDPAAPQKWQKVLDYRRIIDLEHGRTRVEQRVKMDFPFASTAGQLGLNRSSETLDGDVAYNIGGGGFLAAPQAGTPQPQAAGAAAARQRRVELLAHPITIVRAALDPSSKLSNLRQQGSLQLVDVTVREGDTLTLAVNATSGLPEWVSYVGPQANLGDITYRTAFTGYEPEKGVQLPTGFATTIDWRNVVHSKLDVDRNIVDAPIDDLSAPESVRAARPAQGGGAAANLRPVKVAEHVWFMNGNSFFEFDDHLTMMEANRQDAALQAILKVANTLVPGKRVTQVIQSHHHFDHTVGLRAAVAEGLTVISRRGNEAIFHEMVSRPAQRFPDALGRNPKPLKFIAVDDQLTLKDSTNEVDIYHIVGNYHMADGVIVYLPASRVLVEADQTTQNWDFNWWGDSLMNNIEYRNLKIDTVLAVHGQQPVALAEVVSAIERQVRNTQAFCRRAADAQFFQPGCPVHYNRPLPPSSQ